jgi:hypoxanthine phosphoribosyltransferase
VTDRPRFAHASEEELARILDYYGVRWEYEPRTFPILWNLDGKVVESFSPDFYLPELEIYVELTTLKQSLVRRKNRKLRRLRELYPDIRAKLFYGKDFRALMLKYGRFDLAASLSGLEGQYTPERPESATSPTVPIAAVAEPDASAEKEFKAVATPAMRARASRGTRRRRGRHAFARAEE